MKKLIFLFMAVAGLCACSSDDDLSIGSTTPETFDGDVAYMVINIKDAASATRATAGDLVYGSENTIESGTNAHFYFYDAAGVFVSNAQVWGGGTAETAGQIGPVEFKSNTVLVLRGLTDKNYPKYMVTILNQPTGFTAPWTLEEMQTQLLNTPLDGYFTMSTSSYYDATDEVNKDAEYAFTNVLDASYFLTEPLVGDPDLDKSTPAVEVYVERLAAKVNVIASEEPVEIDNATIAGTANDDLGVDDEGDEPLYIQFLGWKLNATARNSNIVKNISNWTEEDDVAGWTAWNDAKNWRSYWGASFNYGITHTYPVSSDASGITDDSGENQIDLYLKYYNLNDETLNSFGLDYPEYCAENTNTAEILGTSKYTSAITHVLVKAHICDEQGNGVSVVRYNGLIYTLPQFIDYAFEEIKEQSGIAYYYCTDATLSDDVEGKYVLLDDKHAWVEPGTNGSVVLTLHNFEEGSIYTYNSEDKQYELVSPENIETALSTMQNALDSFIAQGDVNGYLGTYNGDGNYTDGGLMYYCIPIEHLNETNKDEVTGEYEGLIEANYGVVRNHWYQVTIDSVENLGRGISNPDEVIIPDPSTYDPTKYYVVSNINILSWQIVNQSVDL